MLIGFPLKADRALHDASQVLRFARGQLSAGARSDRPIGLSADDHYVNHLQHLALMQRRELVDESLGLRSRIEPDQQNLDGRVGRWVASSHGPGNMRQPESTVGSYGTCRSTKRWTPGSLAKVNSGRRSRATDCAASLSLSPRYSAA